MKDFEKISYRLKVIKDEYPSIITQSNKDSTSVENTQFMGQISDDYGINTLEIVYYKKDFPNQKNSLLLKTTKATTQTFFFQFPK